MMDSIDNFKFYFKKKTFFKDYLKYTQSKEYNQSLEEIDKEFEALFGQVRIGLWSVEIYDILDNDGMNKVVKKLHSLKNGNRCHYDVTVNYRKSRFKKSQYARVEIGYTSTTNVGVIKFNNDNYIGNISIRMTQISNNDFILCYNISLRKLFNDKELRKGIHENFNIIKKSNNCTWYPYEDSFFKKPNYKQVLQLETDWLRDWFQGTIEHLSFTKMGKFYKLPIIFNYSVNKKTDSFIDELKKPFLANCFVDEEENEFLHVYSYKHFSGSSIDRFTFGRTRKESSFLEYFSLTGFNFYYFLFDKVENSEIQRRFGKYFTHIKKRIKTDDQKWLINKIRALKEKEIHDKLFKKLDAWTHYRNGEKTEFSLSYYPYYRDKYLDMYTEYLDYIASINTLNYNSIIFWITTSTLVATIMGIVIGIYINKSP